MPSPRSLRQEGRWVGVVGRQRKLRGWMIKKRTQGTKEAFRSRKKQGGQFCS